MINPIHEFLGISGPDQLPLLDSNKFKNLNLHCYWKDRSGKYVGVNDQYAIDAGLKRGTEFSNYYDTDLFPNEADSLTTNDAKVLSDNALKIFIETATLQNSILVNAISHKSPWYSSLTNRLLGIVGYTIIYHKIFKDDIKDLSSRQLECLFYLVKGYSAKQIGKKICLSYRTVEDYLTTAKIKLNCNNRAELIEKALKLKVIKDRL